ncbi:aspartate kinase [Desulfobotulus sp. H1]|uniref:aspartate kinase n=1 Tax=Desulfobotulus pelophilus TaxID=2823377 RepID=A0ABT3NC62_9BACT|nr:aspartate kinase [Desulfobotulus pelophilus]MCW7755049.1 aspartate kinase [Desulfobotulus pelophilus]
MKTRHTVEKIGGTSMSRFSDVLQNIILGHRKQDALYNRIFVVSAYGGITDLLLEHKKTREPGVYGLFANDDVSWAWGDSLNRVAERMIAINAELAPLGLDLMTADRFVRERIEGARSCLLDLTRLCSFGHFQLEEHLMTVREMLSAVGEAHSAFNTVQILQNCGINARLVDLSGWMEECALPINEKIQSVFSEIDVSQEMPVVTGYTRCKEGLMATFDRGYSEITFSKVACLTGAGEAIIHKEFHLSSGDPKLMGPENVAPMGRTNYDVADQLSDLGMEAIHPQAAKGLRQAGIPIRVKNTFEPEHPGTVIDCRYRSKEPCVEIIAGRESVLAIEIFDQDRVGYYDREAAVCDVFRRFKMRSIGKNLNANTIIHYVDSSLKRANRLTEALEETFPGAEVTIRKIALIAAIGSNMKVPGFLAKATGILHEAGINILALQQSMRQVDMQFIVAEEDYARAAKALHKGLVEEDAHRETAATGADAMAS